MTKEREKKLVALFRNYRKNKKELDKNYDMPIPGAIAYDKVKVVSNGRNSQEDMVVNYIYKRENLFKKVYIVEEVINWFKLEGHGRDRFVRVFMIGGCSWNQTESELHISKGTLHWWRKDVLEKADLVSKWLNYE